MSNKARKFKRVYMVVVEGRSRGWEGEPTFMEEIISTPIGGIVRVLQMQYPSLKITYKENDLVKGGE